MFRLIFIFLFGFYFNSLIADIDPREFDYEGVDSLMQAHQKDTFENPQALANFINQNYTTDHEKFRSVFWWITHNIQENYASEQVNSNAVFESKKGNCDGFADLTDLLCAFCKIKSRKVSGVLKYDVDFFEDSSDITFSTWNIVTLN